MRLHIGNIPKNLAENEVRDLVTPFGEPTSLELVKDAGGASKGFAFAEFADDAKAGAVINGLNGKEIGGQSLKVSEARPRKEGNAQAGAGARR